MGVEVLSGSGVTLAEGAVWTLVIAVTDDCYPANVTPTVLVTPPIGPDVSATVEAYGGGWRATYPTVSPGLHAALVDAAAFGQAAVVALVNEAAGSAAWPDVTDLDSYLREHSATTEELADTLAAETAAQFAACRIPGAYPPDLRNALLRRCARNLALKGIPLAVLQGDSESGATILPGRDPEVRRLEGPYRKVTVR